MIRKTLLLRLILISLLVVDLLSIITVFLKSGTDANGGLDVGLAIGSFILLPFLVMGLLEVSRAKKSTKEKMGITVWVIWGLVAVSLFLLIFYFFPFFWDNFVKVNS